MSHPGIGIVRHSGRETTTGDNIAPAMGHSGLQARLQLVGLHSRALGNETVFEPSRLFLNHDADSGLTSYGEDTAADTFLSQQTVEEQTNFAARKKDCFHVSPKRRNDPGDVNSTSPRIVSRVRRPCLAGWTHHLRLARNIDCGI